MRFVFLGLLIGGVGILTWTYVQYPTEWEEWSLETQKKIALWRGDERVLAIEEALFHLRKDALLAQYEKIEEEYMKVKKRLEQEFYAIKEQLEARGISIDDEVVKFQQQIEEKKQQLEAKKAEIEAKIATIKAEYEATKQQLQELTDSVNQVKTEMGESMDAIEGLRDAVTE